MATEAQIRANQANARKSTGPTSAEGKAISRRNGLKHGLAGDGTVLPPELEAELGKRLASWTRTLKPTDDVERFLVRRAALSSLKLDYATRHSLAALSLRVRHAEESWRRDRLREVQALVDRVESGDRPESACRDLHQTADGCRWLALQWEYLARELDTCGHWRGPHLLRAVYLLGEPRRPDEPGPITTAMVGRNESLRQLIESDIRRHRDDWTPELIDRPKSLFESDLPSDLPGLVRAEIHRLRSLITEVEARLDLSDVTDSTRLAFFQPEHDLPLRRYESAHELGMYRALDQLSKRRLSQSLDPSSPPPDLPLPPRRRRKPVLIVPVPAPAIAAPSSTVPAIVPSESEPSPSALVGYPGPATLLQPGTRTPTSRKRSSMPSGAPRFVSLDDRSALKNDSPPPSTDPDMPSRPPRRLKGASLAHQLSLARREADRRAKAAKRPPSSPPREPRLE